jgi:hypothetical protein
LLNVDLCEVEILLHLVHDFVGNAGFKALDKCLAQLLPHVCAKVLRHCIQQLVEADDHRLIYSSVLGLRNEEDQDVGVAGDHEGEILKVLHEEVTKALDHLVHGCEEEVLLIFV